MRHTLTRSLIAPLILLTGIMICLPPTARSQESNSAIQVIPAPRQASATGEKFLLSPRTLIALAEPRAEDDRFAAQDFIADLNETAGLNLKVGKGRTTILVGAIQLPQIQAALKRAGRGGPADLDPEGYLLSVRPAEVVVAGKTAAGVFYGLQTLKQLVRGQGAAAFIQGCRIVDWPALRWRAVSD